MLRIALPNKGTLAEPAATMMREAGYRQRNDNRDLSMLDEENDIEFFYLRPKDIATYVGSGDLQLGITGADLMDESGSQVRGVLPIRGEIVNDRIDPPAVFQNQLVKCRHIAALHPAHDLQIGISLPLALR